MKRITLALALAAPVTLGGCETYAQGDFAAPVPFNADGYCDAAPGTGEFQLPRDLEAALEGPPASSDQSNVPQLMLEAAARKVAHHSLSSQECRQSLATGQQKFDALIKGKQAAFETRAGFAPSSDPKIRAIQNQIALLWRDDQAARGALVALMTKDESGADYWASRLVSAHTKRGDDRSITYLSSRLPGYGWIDIDRFGEDVSSYAWLIAQHADDYPNIQKDILARMEPYLETGGVSRENYAFLWDRVAVNTGGLQRYGTQPDWTCVDGEMKLRAMEEPSQVNERRAAMGMGTVEDGLERMNRQTCPA